MREAVENYVRTWEDRCYFDGVPDEVPLRLMQLSKAPSWKACAMAILKHDSRLIGVERPHSDYYDQLKQIELAARCDRPMQLRLF